MIPAATQDYIKSDKKPTGGHMKRNDKRWLAWVHRNDSTPRIQEPKMNGSQRVWDCMVYEYQKPAEVANMSTQCSLRSDSGIATPPQAPRGILTSVQSQPQIAREASRLWPDDRIPFRDLDPRDNGSESGILAKFRDVVGENVPPMQLEPLEDLGSTIEAEKFTSKTPTGEALDNSGTAPRAPRTRPERSLTPRRGDVTPRDGTTPRMRPARSPRPARSLTPRRGDMTPPGGWLYPAHMPRSATPRSATPRSVTPRATRQSGSEISGTPSAAWR